MPDQNDEPSKGVEAGVPAQLYTKDESGNYVPVVVETASGSNAGEEAAMVLAMQRRHAGPLPSADTFREYGSVLPTAPERIMRMAEKEQEASHEARRTHQRDERHLVSQGQWMGFLSMAIALVGGIYMASQGQILFACALVSPAVLTPIMRFYFKGKYEAENSTTDSDEEI